MTTTQGAAVRPSGVFFGWFVAGGSLLGLVFGFSSFMAIAFSLFITSLQGEFGWSRTEISFGSTIVNTLVIALSFGAGALIDRFGVRRVMLVSATAFGLLICSMAMLTGSLFHYYMLYVLVPIAGIGLYPISYSRLMLNWFDRHRGLALGIALSGVGLAGIIVPMILQSIIGGLGWRAAYLAFGLAVLLITLPLTIFVLRERPEDMGLAPDGDPPVAHTGQAAAKYYAGNTLTEAARQRTFWQLLVAFALLGAISMGTLMHLAPLVTDRGMDPRGVMAVYGAAAIIGRIACGLLVDRFFAPFVAVGFMVLLTSGIGLFAAGFDGSLLYLAAFLFGLALGSEFDLMSFMVSRYQGLASYGKIYGAVYAVFSAGAAIGPLALGWSYDALGGYERVLTLFIGGMVVAIALLATLGPYRWNVVREEPVPLGAAEPEPSGA